MLVESKIRNPVSMYVHRAWKLTPLPPCFPAMHVKDILRDTIVVIIHHRFLMLSISTIFKKSSEVILIKIFLSKGRYARSHSLHIFIDFFEENLFLLKTEKRIIL